MNSPHDPTAPAPTHVPPARGRDVARHVPSGQWADAFSYESAARELSFHGPVRHTRSPRAKSRDVEQRRRTAAVHCASFSREGNCFPGFITANARAVEFTRFSRSKRLFVLNVFGF